MLFGCFEDYKASSFCFYYIEEDVDISTVNIARGNLHQK